MSELIAGTQVGPYVLQEQIGAGGMGQVFRADDPRLHRSVAIKFLPMELARDATALERFQREARSASALSHPNICAVHDIGEHAGRPFLVLELLQGETCQNRLARGPMPVAEALKFAVQIADALDAAHRSGVVHRDIKPANLFFTSSGQAKVLDFGIAKLLAREESNAAMAASDAVSTITVDQHNLTRAGTLVGTLAYMSPEQLRCEELDARTDVFSFATVLYEMLTGRRAFAAHTSAELAQSILTATPPPLRALQPKLPQRLERAISTALAKDRKDRFGSMGQFRDELQVLLAPSLGRRAFVATGATAAAAAGAVVYWGRDVLPVGPRKVRVAILPFEDLGRNPDAAWFTRGLHSDLITTVSRLYPGHLAVIAQTSIRRYAGKPNGMEELTRDLKPDYIVEGTVQKEGNRVRIAARLIHTKDQSNTWSQNIERDVTELLQMQSHIADSIAHGIQRSLRPVQAVQASLQRPLNPAAHEAYLKREFQKAVEIDPGYAPAWVGLGTNEYFSGFFGAVPPNEAFPKARQSAEKAIALDPTLPRGYGIRGLANLHFEWKWADVEADFRRALELDPGEGDVRHHYAHFLLSRNRGDDSARVCAEAVELDPFNPTFMACMGWHALWAGKYDEAVSAATRALNLEPKNGWAYMILGWAYEQKSKYEEALGALDKALQVTMRTSSVAHVLAGMGRRPAARDLLQELLERGKSKYVSAYDVALVYEGLGEKDRAFEALERAYQERSGLFPHVNWDPRFRSMRTDRRFEELLRRAEIPLPAA